MFADITERTSPLQQTNALYQDDTDVVASYPDVWLCVATDGSQFKRMVERL